MVDSNNVNNQAPVSSITSLPFGNSAVDIMAYVELLLVQEYDQQLKNIAGNIKTSNKLKEAYRNQKTKINDLLGKGQDKDGKVNLTPSNQTLLYSKPTYTWNSSLNDGAGGVEPHNASYSSNNQSKKVSADEIKAEVERLQAQIDNLNSGTELAQIEIATITSQRKLAFETTSATLSKTFEGAGAIVRNIK